MIKIALPQIEEVTAYTFKGSDATYATKEQAEKARDCFIEKQTADAYCELLLPQKIDTCDFRNGNGYGLIEVKLYNRIKDIFYEVLSKDKFTSDVLKNGGFNNFLIGRILDDVHSPWYPLYLLFIMHTITKPIKKDGKVYYKIVGQPFFKDHEDQIKGGCIFINNDKGEI